MKILCNSLIDIAVYSLASLGSGLTVGIMLAGSMLAGVHTGSALALTSAWFMLSLVAGGVYTTIINHFTKKWRV